MNHTRIWPFNCTTATTHDGLYQEVNSHEATISIYNSRIVHLFLLALYSTLLHLDPQFVSLQNPVTINKKFLSSRVVNAWNSLSEDTIQTTTVSIITISKTILTRTTIFSNNNSTNINSKNLNNRKPTLTTVSLLNFGYLLTVL